MLGRRLKVAIVAIALVAIGVLAWTQRPHDATDHATVRGAVEDFNRDLRDGAAVADEFPQPGVYRYSTRGGESIDTAVLDTNHDYEGVSTLTLISAPCGIEERWQVLATRWSEVRACRTRGGIRLESLSEYREFFGTALGFRYRCDRSSTPAPRNLVVGTRWRMRCSAKDGSVSSRAEVVGLVRTRIAGRSVEAVRIRIVGALRGENEGTTIRSEWLRRSDGLVLRRTVSTKTSFDFVGGGNYEERYTLALLSTSPLS